jgi:tetratricopeptide (TPR) repeat protein
MRPDSQLYIVPAAGGVARRMRCNTPLMNSWHSFSPNGRWLVFSSKSRSPYTQMFLTHLDTEGNDSPPILIENSTAANRAVNIPEFVNIPPDGMMKIDVPAAESYRLFDSASDLAAQGQLAAAIVEWKKVLELDPGNAKAHNNLGGALLRQGNLTEAMTHFQKALEADPGLSQAQGNWGIVLFWEGKLDAAMPHLQRALELDSANAQFYESFISKLDLPASPPPAGLKLEDAGRPQAEQGTIANQGPTKRERLDDHWRRSLKAVLDYIVASDDPARLALREGQGPHQPNPRESQDAVQAPSASPSFALAGGRPEIEKLIADLDVPRLRGLAAQARTPEESFAAGRQVLLTFLYTLDASHMLLEQKRNAQALACLEIAAQAAPRNPYIAYDLARAQALTSQQKRALSTLQAAVEKGFTDADRVERDRAFEGLRTEADYQKALAKMRNGKPQTEAAP